MRTDKSNAGEPAYYTIREAAWILGVKSLRPSPPRSVWARCAPCVGAVG